MFKECKDCEFKGIGTRLGNCYYSRESSLSAPYPCTYGDDGKFKLELEIKKTENMNRFLKGEKVYHKTYKKYGIFDIIDAENYDKAFIYLYDNNSKIHERKRVSLKLLKKYK